jgi:hypothetical protein
MESGFGAISILRTSMRTGENAYAQSPFWIARQIVAHDAGAGRFAISARHRRSAIMTSAPNESVPALTPRDDQKARSLGRP